VLNLKSASHGPQSIQALWSSPDEDRVIVLGKKSGLYSYDARRAEWKKIRNVGPDYSAIVGRDDAPILLHGNNGILELSTNRKYSRILGPVASEDGRVAYVDTNTLALHEADSQASRVLFKPIPVCDAGQELLWSVELDGGVVIGLDKEYLWWPQGADRPQRRAYKDRLQGKEFTWVQSADVPFSIWAWNEEGGLYEVTPYSIRTITEGAESLLGVLGELLFWKHERGSYWAVKSDGEPWELKPDLSGDRPSPGSAWQPGSDAPWLALDATGRLLIRASSAPCKLWQPSVAGWKSISNVSTLENSVIITGEDFQWNDRVVRATFQGDELSMEADFRFSTKSLQERLTDVQLVDTDLFGKEDNWLQDPDTGDLLNVDLEKKRIRGRLSLGTSLLLENFPSIKEFKERGKGRLWIKIDEEWCTYEAFSRGGHKPVENSIVPEVGIKALTFGESGYSVELTDGTECVFSGGRFCGEPKFPLDGMKRHDGKLKVEDMGVALFSGRSKKPLFVVPPGDPWPGLQGFMEAVFLKGAFYPLSDGWPAEEPVEPDEVPGAVQVWDQVWRVPLAGRQEVLVEKGRGGLWKKLNRRHPLIEQLDGWDGTPRGPAFLTLEEFRSLSTGDLAFDAEGVWLPFADEVGLGWGNNGWERRPFKGVKGKSGKLTIDDKGNLPTEKWSRLDICATGVMVSTEAGTYLIPNGSLTKASVHDAVAVTGEQPLVEKLKPRNAMQKTRVTVRNNNNLVFHIPQKNLNFGLNLNNGLMEHEIIRELSIDGKGMGWLVRTMDDVIREPDENGLSRSQGDWIMPKKPDRYYLPGKFKVRNNRLSWTPAGLTIPVDLGSLNNSTCWVADDVKDVMPAEKSGIYHLSSSGLWLWRNGERKPVAGGGGSYIVDGKLVLTRLENGGPRHALIDSGGIMSLKNETAKRVPQITASVIHPLTGPGEKDALRWNNDDSGKVTFQVSIRTPAGEVQRDTRFMTGAFEHELPVGLCVRNGDVVFQADPGIERKLDAVGKRIVLFEPSRSYNHPSFPNLVVTGQNVEFKRSVDGFLEPWIRDFKGNPIKMERSANGQFRQDRLKIIASSGGSLVYWTEAGLIENNKELGRVRILPDNPIGRSIEKIIVDDRIYLQGSGGICAWNGNKWEYVSLDNSPFAPHRYYVLKKGSGRWRSVPVGNGRGFDLEYRFGCGTWRKANFDFVRGGFNMDIAACEVIEDCVRYNGKEIQWQTVAGWQQQRIAKCALTPGELMLQNPAPPPQGQVQTKDGRMEVCRTGGENVLKIYNLYSKAPPKLSFSIPWIVKDGRFSHDCVLGISAIPGKDTFVLATKAGLRELNCEKKEVDELLVPLPSHSPGIVTRLFSDKTDIVAEINGKWTYWRGKKIWSALSRDEFKSVEDRFIKSADRLKSAPLRWAYNVESAGLRFHLRPEKGSEFELKLDNGGFLHDRPKLVFEEKRLWLEVVDSLYYVDIESKGLWSKGVLDLVREGEAPEKVGQHRTDQFERLLVIDRKGKTSGLDHYKNKWNRPVDLFPYDWAAFLSTELLIKENIIQNNNKSTRSLQIDWQPPAFNGIVPPRALLEAENGCFKHDDIWHIAGLRGGDKVRLLSATGSGLLMRDIETIRFLDLRQVPGKTVERFLLCKEGVIGRSADNRQLIESKPLLVMKPMEAITIHPMYTGPCLSISRTDDVNSKVFFSELLDNRSLEVSNPGMLDGHLPGDIVGATFIDKDGLWMMTGHGVVRYKKEKSGRYELIPGFRRPPGETGHSAFKNKEIAKLASQETWHGWSRDGVLWLTRVSGKAIQIYRFTETGKWGKADEKDWLAARSAAYERPGWKFYHNGFGSDLRILCEALRRSERVYTQVSIYMGALDPDYCHGLSRAAEFNLMSCPQGIRVLQGAFNDIDLILASEYEKSIVEVPFIGENVAGYPCIAVWEKTGNQSFRTQTENQGQSVHDIAVILQLTEGNLENYEVGDQLNELRRTQFADDIWNIYLNSQEQLNVVRKDRGLHLAGERIFAEGQFTFDRVAFLVGEPDRAIAVTHAGLEALNTDEGLYHIANLEDVPCSVGLDDGCITLTLGGQNRILDGIQIKPFTGAVCLPRSNLSLNSCDHNIHFSHGLLSIDGNDIVLAGEVFSAFEAAQRLWLLEKDTVRWVRLEDRWIDKMIP